MHFCSKKVFQKYEYLWGKWIWQAFPGENGEKRADDQRLHFDIFLSLVLCQFSFHCNFRICKLKHEITEMSEWNFHNFSSLKNITVISFEQKCPDAIKKKLEDVKTNSIPSSTAEAPGGRSSWHTFFYTGNLWHRGGGEVTMWQGKTAFIRWQKYWGIRTV